MTPRRALILNPQPDGMFARLTAERETRSKGSWAFGVFAALAFVLGLAFGISTARAATPTESFVQQNIDRGYAILNNANLSPDARRTQFREFMLALTDLRRIALFTLGQYVNGASKSEQDDYVNAFTDYATAVYETRLGKYKGQTLKVTGSVERAADDIVVNADVVDSKVSNPQPIKAAFRVRKTSDGRSIVIDMQVEGIWLAVSQRSDFTSYLQQNAGKVPVLAAHLRQQAEKIRAGTPVDQG